MSCQVVRWTRTAGCAVAHVAGDLDLATAVPTFAAIAEGWLGDQLVIDLTEVDFMDSTALGQLTTISGDKVVRLVAPGDNEPRRVLEITHLTARFPTFVTVEDALAARP